MIIRRLLCFSLMFVAFTSFAMAQSRNELGLLLGGTLVPNQTINSAVANPASITFNKGLTYQATFAHRLYDAHLAALYFELPFLATPNADIHSDNPLVPTALASLFITPGLRVKVLPGWPISPWASVGGGYARFDEGSMLQDGSTNTGKKGTNTGAIQFGGGVDVHLIPLISLRGEVRDFYSGHPQFNVTANSHQHNVVVSGGFVVNF